MKLEVGKRYVRRDGKITDPLLPSASPCYPFRDPKAGECYTENGLYYLTGAGCHYDLVSEYNEPNTLESIEKALAAERIRASEKLAELESRLNEARQPKRKAIKHGDYGHNKIGELRLFLKSMSGDVNSVGDKNTMHCGVDVNNMTVDEYTILGNIFEDMKKK